MFTDGPTLANGANSPKAPQSLRAVLERRYGAGALDAAQTRLVGMGAEVGIEYHFERTSWINSFDAHRLVAWSASQTPDQTPLVDALFRAYFTDGANIADTDTLVNVAASVALDANAARAALHGDDYAGIVRADEAQARELEITGVPAFVVDERFLIPGALDVGVFERALQRAAANAT